MKIATLLTCAAGAAILTFGGASPAAADIVFCSGGGCAAQGETVHLGSDDGTAGSEGGAFTVVGSLQSDPTLNVLITSNEAISTSADGFGQAWVIPNDFVEGIHSGPPGDRTPDTGGLNFLSFEIEGGTFTHLEFRVTPIDTNDPGATDAWTLVLNGYDLGGVHWTESFGGLGNNEFFNITAINGQVMTSANFTMDLQQGAIQKVAQIRIDGAVGIIPEPATWAMMILGFGAAGAMLRRRRLALA